MIKEPRKKDVTQGIYKLIDGIWHKRCNGPAHDEPTYLPATEKYFYVRKSPGRREHFVSNCRLCNCWRGCIARGLEVKGLNHGFVDRSQVIHIYQEAVNRLGLMELSKRTGLSYEGLSLVLYGRTRRVRKANLRKVMLELISARRHGINSPNQLVPKSNARWQAQRRGQGFDTKYCTGCGVLIEKPDQPITEGCRHCADRLAHFNRRNDPKKIKRDKKYNRKRYLEKKKKNSNTEVSGH